MKEIRTYLVSLVLTYRVVDVFSAHASDVCAQKTVYQMFKQMTLKHMISVR